MGVSSYARRMRRRLWVLALVAVAATARADDTTLAALLARTDAVAKEVAKIRGLPLRRAIENEVVDRDELHARLAKMASDRKTAAETTAEGTALARWGMIPLGIDYTQEMVELLTEQIAGYYDPETKKLTISKSAGDDPSWAEMVLAHELDHGLQDQAFDLHTFEDLPDTEGDAALARHSLVEGDGIALMVEVLLARRGITAPWANPQIATNLEKAMTQTGDTLDKAPLAIRETMLFPYREGFAFVAALRRKKPWTAVDAAFKHPPRSTEQIMHPERYLAGDEPIAITARTPVALAGYTLLHSTVWGELGFELFLRSHHLEDAMAARAAAGWGGDRVIALARPGDTHPEHAVGLARFDWDSEADAVEAYDAAVRAIDDAVVGGTIERGDPRTRWLALDGTQAWVERRGSALVLALGVPSWAGDALLVELWQDLAPARK